MKRLFLNFFEVLPSKTEIKVYYLHYESYEQLISLRRKFPDIIFTPYNKKIYINFGKKEDLKYKIKDLGESLVSLDSEPYLFLKLIAHSYLEIFWKNEDKFRITPKKGGTYKVTIIDNDIAEGKFKGIELYKTFNIHFTPLTYHSLTHIGFTISTSVTAKVIWNLNDFIGNNILTDGLEFEEESGQILSNNKAINCLREHFSYSERLREEQETHSFLQNELEDIVKFERQYFSSRKDEILLPNDLKISFLDKCELDFNKPGSLFTNYLIDVPESYFYKGKCPPQKVSSYLQRTKISFNKPFSFSLFENKIINISIIVPKNKRRPVAQFFNEVQNELERTFRILKENIKFTAVEIDKLELQDYINARRQINRKSDLVIIVVDQEHESLPPSSSPYYYCKAKFLEQGLNTQEVQIQQVEKFLFDKNNHISNYTDHNIALNIYAKLGGTGWTVRPQETKDELVIGIGATTDKEGQPILGLMNIFHGNGKYIFGKVSSVTNMNSYSQKLEKILSENIQEYIQTGILDTNNPCRLVFHIFKSVGKNNEIQALKNVMSKFNGYDFEYAFIHVGLGHNYRLFTYADNISNPVFETKNRRGLNKRGTFVKINDNLGFICLSEKSSAFLKLQIDERSSFDDFDLDYLALQVYQFTELSHTSYNKAGKPVTIRYPKAMARLTEQLKEVNGFDLDEINAPDNSLWFI